MDGCSVLCPGPEFTSSSLRPRKRRLQVPVVVVVVVIVVVVAGSMLIRRGEELICSWNAEARSR